MAAKLPVAWPVRGRYVVAVSGGRDSMALLDLLARVAGEHHYELVVAHFDHGLRADSGEDRALVEKVAKSLGLPVASEVAALSSASEAAARTTRYDFLERMREKHEAVAVMTAHHQDDLIETSLLNLARGTGRHGLAPMQGQQPLRPLLAVSRNQLAAYAAARQLQWREDTTNEDRSNPRNFLRHELLAGVSPAWRKQYLAVIDQMAAVNEKTDSELVTLLKKCPAAIKKTEDSSEVSGLAVPAELIHDGSLEELAELIVAIAHCLSPGIELEHRLVQELALFAKTGQPGRVRPLRAGLELQTTREGCVIWYTR